MNYNEFLNGLREALENENELSQQAVQDNMSYYRGYIEDEMRKGRAEQEILDELGDPWLIAKTLSEAPGGNAGYTDADQSYVQEDQYESQSQPHVHVFGLDTWWKKLLAVLVVVGIIMLVISIVTGIISILLPIAIPFLVIAFVIRLFSNRK